MNLRDLFFGIHTVKASSNGTCPYTKLPYYKGDVIRRTEDGGEWFLNQSLRILRSEGGMNATTVCDHHGWNAEEAWDLLQEGKAVTIYNKYRESTTFQKSSYDGKIRKAGGVRPITKSRFLRRNIVIWTCPDIRKSIKLHE